MSQKTMIHDLTTGNVAKELIIFSLPFILSQFLQTLYGLVDMIIIGQFVGHVGLAAVSIGGDMLSMYTFLVVGFASAGQVIIAQYVGMGDYDSVSRTVGTFSTFIMAMGVVFTAIGFIFGETFLRWLNVPPEAHDQAYAYTMVCYTGTIFIFGYNIVSAILRGMGDSKTPFVFIAVATAVNVVLDLLFIAVMGLDAFGAALATVTGQAVAFISAVIYLMRKREAFGFDFKLKSFKIDPSLLRVILRLGIPMSIQSCAIGFSELVVHSFVNSYGVVAAAVNGVGNKLGAVARIITGALHTAGATMVGQNFAARKLDRVTRVAGVIAFISLTFAVILSVLMILFPEQIFSIFDDSPAVLEMAHMYVVIAVVNFMGYASRSPFIAVINGIGHAKLSFVIGVIDSFVARLGIAILLGYVFNMGIMGFWLGGVLGGYAYTVIGGAYYFSGKWKTRPLAVA